MVGDLKTLVFKYETSNIISQSYSLPVLLISVPAFVGRNKKYFFSKKDSKYIKSWILCHWRERQV